jgi:tRNA (guanine-N7-)-methyltransferase
VIQLTKVRVRQHVNPLCSRYQQQRVIPDWHNIYYDLSLPIHLDIGCARGKFILEMAQIQPKTNFLGIEIRDPLVQEANSKRNELNLTNLYYWSSNINIDLKNLLASLPENQLEWVTIQFPDPWFKKRHQKRRVVQPELVNILTQYLATEGKIFLQSDVKAVAEEMGDRFRENPDLFQTHSETWLAENPFPIATEREKATLAKGEPVYRLLFQKKAKISLNFR